MLKNTASQSIGAQLVAVADGTAFTGAVVVSVTGDNGAQATGSVGSGACTHEGNGYHSYAPAQAETNYSHVAFTFTGTGAIPVTVQVFTIAGDAFTRLGAPAGASVSADVAAVKVQTAAIEVDTAEIGAAGAGLTNINLPNQTMDIVGSITGNLSGSVGSVTGAVGSVTGAVGSVTGAVGSVTGLTAATVHADLDDIQARLPAALTANGNIKADTLRVGGTVQTGGDLATLVIAVDDFVDTEVATISSALNAVLALLDDARTEPGQGAPPVNPDAMTKLDYIYKSWRNKKDNNGTETKLYADNGTTVDHKQATSESAGTVTKAEWITGA